MQKPKSNRCGIYVSELDRKLLTEWLEHRCLELWQQLQHPDDRTRTIHAYWQDECRELMPRPAAFDGFVEFTKRVSSTCLIHYERNRYSVPACFANRPISLRVYSDRLAIVADGEKVAEHVRLFSRSHDNQAVTVYDWRHYLAVVQRKPGALRNGIPFKSLPKCFQQLQSILLKRRGGDREMADILALVMHYDEKLVEQAVALTLSHEVPSKQHVLNNLSRLCDVPKPAPIKPPAALQLRLEPIANASRYDGLREMLK